MIGGNVTVIRNFLARNDFEIFPVPAIERMIGNTLISNATVVVNVLSTYRLHSFIRTCNVVCVCVTCLFLMVFTFD